MTCKLIKKMSELNTYKHIIRALVFKNIFGRYKNSIVGFGWNFITPIVTMVAYYVIFSEFRTNAIPNFWIYLSTGLFSFTFMLGNIIGGASCFINNSGMIKKMYFPREIIVISQIISSAIIMLIGYLVVFMILVISGSQIGINLIYLPLALILMALFVTGCTLAISSITVYIRDVQYFLNSTDVLFYFATPMYFLTSNLEKPLNVIIWLNPLTHYIELFHCIIYYNIPPSMEQIFYCTIITSIALFTGITIFSKLKKGFAERL